MQGALGIGSFRLTRYNQDTSARVISGEFFDPQYAITIFQEWLDQQNIRPMCEDQFARVVKTMRTTANLIPLVASYDCGHPLFADTRVPDHYDPAWFCVHAS